MTKRVNALVDSKELIASPSQERSFGEDIADYFTDTYTAILAPFGGIFPGFFTENGGLEAPGVSYKSSSPFTLHFEALIHK